MTPQPVTFASLPIGARFDFVHRPEWRDIAPNGPDGYVKRSARGWTHPTYGDGRVGTVRVLVIPR